MATTRKTKLLIWSIALTLGMACVVPAVATPALPTFDPAIVNTFIAQTANAAATGTAAALPSSTPTPSITPTRNTETPSPTVTATVIFILSSPTPIIIPTFTNTNVILGGSGNSSDNFACRVTKVSPPNGSSFGPRDDFDVTWTVQNIGRKTWDRSDVDYTYSSGAKIHKISGYDLDSNVKVGNSINLGVDMQAPKDPGTYQTIWTMRIGERTFCPMTYTLIVK